MGGHTRYDDNNNGGSESVEVADKTDSKPVKTVRKGRRGFGKKGGVFRKRKALKGQIRGLERLLQYKGSNLVPKARKAKEAQLAELKRIDKEHDRREREKIYIERYRMVKFFERRKLERVLENIKKDGDKVEDAERKKQAMRDLRYIKEFPSDEKYIALFPKEGHTEKSKVLIEEMRSRIEVGDRHALSAVKEADRRNDGEEEDDFFMNE